MSGCASHDLAALDTEPTPLTPREGEVLRLIAEGRARPHHVLPDSGWVTASLETEHDVDNVVSLFRLGYERAVAQAERARV